MKLLANILAFLVLFLAASPGLNLIQFPSNVEQTCCSVQCGSDSDLINTSNQEQEENSQSPCSPFQSCCLFVLQDLNALLAGINCPEQLIKPSRYYSTNFISQFAPNFWQPPKIA